MPANLYVVIALVFVVAVLLLAKRFLEWFASYRATVQAVKDVDHDKPHWLLGHLLDMQPTQAYLLYMVRLTKKFPKITIHNFGPVKFFLSCHHPDVMKPILSTEEPKDDLVYRFLRPWIGDGLLTSGGTKWKRNRHLLTPAFHFEVLKGYIPIMNDAVQELLDKWSPLGDETIRVEMFHDIGLMSLDTLLRCILSKQTKCQLGGNVEYLEAVKCLTETAMARIHNPLLYFDFVFYLTKRGKLYRKALETAHVFTQTAINERRALVIAENESESIKQRRPDFLDILLMAKDETGTGLTHQEICDEVDTFVFEGHDTVTSAISWAFYHLAKYPDMQEKCRKEVNDIIEEKNAVEWEDLSKMSYLTMFVKESMRIVPPVIGVARCTSKPIFFPRGFGSDQHNVSDRALHGKDASRTVPKLLSIGANIFMLHHNPSVWKNPEVFDPERFNVRNAAKRSPHAYLPFSSGPRNCIGQNFAMNEIKVVLALALSRFRFALDEYDPEPELEPHLITRAKNGIHLLVTKL